MANEVATIKQNNARELATYFEDQRGKFVALMEPKQVDKFMRIISNAILRDPDIADASKQSIFLECQKAAADGLVLDGREAVLTRFKTNKKRKENGKWVDNWQTEVVYIPMIRGLRKLVSQAPQISSWNTGIVYSGEIAAGLFTYTKEPPSIKHSEMIEGDRGAIVGAYSVVRLKNGELLIDFMRIERLRAIKSRTKSRKWSDDKDKPGEITGPWATDEEEMFIKTVARHHFKSIPLGDKLDNAFQRIDGLYDLGGDVMDVEPEPARPTPASVANKRNGGAAAKLDAAKAAPKQEPKQVKAQEREQEEVAHDPETGEVIQEDVDDDQSGRFTEDEY